ncbi:Zinc finger, RING/FYVE/PHD-type [Cynara cardunculus var. scolymus]|uniref:Zinc finger, RING/FYVE/PHD-type n=1 Tax=Cynara cardunculus var. scolymus TaxID=59895 RepID=A0A124SBW9_CYNCS|nr:Zinc finger, RING/FYVE/PHD-type [Cynara cardunculus var. scolymus]
MGGFRKDLIYAYNRNFEVLISSTASSNPSSSRMLMVAQKAGLLIAFSTPGNSSRRLQPSFFWIQGNGSPFILVAIDFPKFWLLRNKPYKRGLQHENVGMAALNKKHRLQAMYATDAELQSETSDWHSEIYVNDGSYALLSGAVEVLRPYEYVSSFALHAVSFSGFASLYVHKLTSFLVLNVFTTGLRLRRRLKGCLRRVTVVIFPPKLHCPLCKEVMKDAVLTSKCCFTSFCDKYLSMDILSCLSRLHQQLYEITLSPKQRVSVPADDLLPNKTLRDTINRILIIGVE